MKISVAVDDAGRILGFEHDSSDRIAPQHKSSVSRKPSNSRAEFALEAEDGQSVHSVELTPELERHARSESFADQLFRHVVVKSGSAVRLEPASR